MLMEEALTNHFAVACLRSVGMTPSIIGQLVARLRRVFKTEECVSFVILVQTPTIVKDWKRSLGGGNLGNEKGLGTVTRERDGKAVTEVALAAISVTAMTILKLFMPTI